MSGNLTHDLRSRHSPPDPVSSSEDHTNVLSLGDSYPSCLSKILKDGC